MGLSVVLYVNDYCPACKDAERWLQEQGIGYKAVNISEKPTAMRSLMSRGIYSVPALFTGDDFCIGFHPDRYERLLRKEGITRG